MTAAIEGILLAAGESRRIVEHAGAGIAVAPEDPDALAQAVDWLRAHPDEAAEMGRRGRAFARTQLRERQAERLEALLADLVAGRV